ncbi:MAG: CAP domain-containing protein [Bacillota bacterium]
MNRTVYRVCAAVVVILLVSLSSAAPALALSAEDQQAYNEWYRARFGSYPGGSGSAGQASGGTVVRVDPSKLVPSQPSVLEQQILDLLNQERVKQGLQPLEMDPYLVTLARLKGQDMAEKGYYGHLSPTYGYVYDMLTKFGVKFNKCSENITTGSTATVVHDSFMGSPKHKANMLKPWWEKVGVGLYPRPGVSSGYNGYFVVEIFVEK